MKKFLIVIVILGLTCVASLFMYISYKADLSIQPIAEAQLKNKQSRPPIYLVSYADGNEVFFRNQNALAYSAINKGFDFILNYRKAILDEDFKQKHQKILDVKKGAGLWLWKPYILLQTMRTAPENSIIIYTDVGFIYVRPIDELVTTLIGSNDVLLMNLDDYHTNEKLVDWTPQHIIHEWHIDSMPEAQRPKFIHSGIVVVRNTARARNFIEKWLEICAREDYAFLKYDAQAENLKGFTYDQSLLSLIAYKYSDGVKIFPQEDFKVFTVFHHRHPGNNKPILPLQTLPAKDLREKIGDVFPSFFLWFGF